MTASQGDSLENREMVFSGVAASPGISIGSCFVFEEPTWHPEPRTVPVEKIPAEKKRFRKAVEKVREHLSRFHKTTLDQFGEDLAEVLEMQVAILEDQVFLHEVEDYMTRHLYDAAYANHMAEALRANPNQRFLVYSHDEGHDAAGCVAQGPGLGRRRLDVNVVQPWDLRVAEPKPHEELEAR